MLSILHTFSFLCIILSTFTTTVTTFVAVSKIQFIGLEENTTFYTALCCVMSFCEVENKHECLRTVQIFITAKLKKSYRSTGV
jgi:hypothetical protein